MGNGEIDRFPVGKLPARYDLVRSTLYARRKALGVRPQKIGNRAYINAKELNLLDDLHQFIQAGGSTAEFLELRGLRRTDAVSSGLSLGQSVTYLERVARNGWLLRTSEIAGLLNLPLSRIQQSGDLFSEAGFIFTRAGYLAQGEIAWRVFALRAA
ncbi:MAG: hypothetical protein QNJ46_27325 [Leptolyngbyaceae cyanobacterium MO_188.B28]|nr:hypothetical protein [Leptolyngbyaceae cyanobacterium MO_188.B28]